VQFPFFCEEQQPINRLHSLRTYVSCTHPESGKGEKRCVRPPHRASSSVANSIIKKACIIGECASDRHCMKLLYSSSRRRAIICALCAWKQTAAQLLSSETKIYFLESLAWPNKGVVADGLIKLVSAVRLPTARFVTGSEHTKRYIKGWIDKVFTKVVAAKRSISHFNYAIKNQLQRGIITLGAPQISSDWAN